MENTRISLEAANDILLSGKELAWPTYAGHKKGRIQLGEPGARRVLAYLLDLDQDKIAEPDDVVFDGIIAAWQGEDDPAEAQGSKPVATVANESWRLDKIETSGFGGLNTHDGPIFEFEVGQETWCLEGQNGSGKTSLISAIIWALTGYIIREHSGLVRDKGVRQPATDANGQQIGDWPPIAAYPNSAGDLLTDATVWVRLCFRNADGERARAYRRVTSPSFGGDPREKYIIDRRLDAHRDLIEIGLLMPNKLGTLGFSDKSQSLYEAVKMLTGLDILADIGQCATAIKRGNGKFLRYSKNKKIDEYKNDFDTWMNKAQEETEITGYDFSALLNIDQDVLSKSLEDRAQEAEAEASRRVEVVIEELAEGIDTKTQFGRDSVKNAVERAKVDTTGKAVRSELLNSLTQRLKNLCSKPIAPFDNAQISRLLGSLTNNASLIGKIQTAHHLSKYGVPDAKDIYDELWRGIKKPLHESLYLIIDWRAHKGDPSTFVSNDNVIEFPSGQKDEVQKFRLINTGVAAAAATDGKVGDGSIELHEIEDKYDVQLHNHTVYQLSAQTLEPVANIGDFIIVSNYASVHERNLVVAGHEGRMLARRYMLSSQHPHAAILTAQSVDPYSLFQPILAPINAINCRKIVGTLFRTNKNVPSKSSDEVLVPDGTAMYRHLLDEMQLFRVDGRSAEPIALNEQYLITGPEISSQQDMSKLDGYLVIAKDVEGSTYFKRFRIAEKSFVILESLNPDGTTPNILASFDDKTSVELASLRLVNGVLFEIPQ